MAVGCLFNLYSLSLTSKCQLPKIYSAVMSMAAHLNVSICFSFVNTTGLENHSAVLYNKQISKSLKKFLPVLH